MMSSSTRVLQFLKALSIAGIALNGLAFIVILVYGLFRSKAMTHDLFWMLLWGTFSVGVPMSGMLYTTLKAREYLRDIHAALKK